MRICWVDLVAQQNSDVLCCITDDDVRALEQKSPQREADKAEIKQKLESGSIFGWGPLEWRRQLLHRLCRIKCFIPSLFTFFEDVKVLQDYAPCMRHLFNLAKGDTIDSALGKAFHGPSVELEKARLLLWLYVRREFMEMPPKARKVDRQLLAHIRPERARADVIYDFARLADEIGFASPKIRVLLAAEAPATCPSCNPTTRGPLGSPKLHHRCGFPDIASFKLDKQLITFDHMASTPKENQPLTSFDALQSGIYAFFCDWTLYIAPQSNGSIDAPSTDGVTNATSATKSMLLDENPAEHAAIMDQPGYSDILSLGFVAVWCLVRGEWEPHIWRIANAPSKAEKRQDRWNLNSIHKYGFSSIRSEKIVSSAEESGIGSVAMLRSDEPHGSVLTSLCELLYQKAVSTKPNLQSQ